MVEAGAEGFELGREEVNLVTEHVIRSRLCGSLALGCFGYGAKIILIPLLVRMLFLPLLLEQGETPEQAYKGIAEFLPTKYGPNGYARIPVYYRALYAKQLKEYQKQISELTADKVRTVVEGQL